MISFFAGFLLRPVVTGNFIGMNLEEYPTNFFTSLEIGETMKVYDGLITLKGAAIKRVETSFMYVDDFEPIPLTEDWLKKFGFTIDAFSSYKNLDEFHRIEIEHSDNSITISSNGDGESICPNLVVKYVFSSLNGIKILRGYLMPKIS